MPAPEELRAKGHERLHITATPYNLNHYVEEGDWVSVPFVDILAQLFLPFSVIGSALAHDSL